MSQFTRAELGVWVAEAFAMLGDVPSDVMLLDFLPGSYDTATGDYTESPPIAVGVQALVTRYRQSELIPDVVLATDRKAAVRQAEMPGVQPALRDRVLLEGAEWYVVDVHQDTGGSLWVLQLRQRGD